MAMPNHLILIRHGESLGNVARGAASRGDESHFTDAFVTTPGREWDLTDVGRTQAATAGAWLRKLLTAPEVAGPRRFYASPYRRTMQTAGHLGLLDDDGASVRWLLNRTLRERDWGEIESMPRSVFEASPLYAAMPAGARSRRIEFLQRAHPVQAGDGNWTMRVGPWMRFGYHRPTNADLLDDNGA